VFTHVPAISGNASDFADFEPAPDSGFSLYFVKLIIDCLLGKPAIATPELSDEQATELNLYQQINPSTAVTLSTRFPYPLLHYLPKPPKEQNPLANCHTFSEKETTAATTHGLHPLFKFNAIYEGTLRTMILCYRPPTAINLQPWFMLWQSCGAGESPVYNTRAIQTYAYTTDSAGTNARLTLSPPMTTFVDDITLTPSTESGISLYLVSLIIHGLVKDTTPSTYVPTKLEQATLLKQVTDYTYNPTSSQGAKDEFGNDSVPTIIENIQKRARA
jgi:hypothetical protein